MDKMSALMQGLRDKPLTEIAGHTIVKVTDYQKPEETGLPAANVLIYKLDNGETVVVRPSGTEPKIKIYYTTLGKNLEEAEAEKEKLAEALNVNVNYLLSEDDAFIADIEDKYGRRGARQAQELLTEVTGLFAGGEMADEDMREMVDAIQEAYLIAKKNNKKYTPKKYRKDE